MTTAMAHALIFFLSVCRFSLGYKFLILICCNVGSFIFFLDILGFILYNMSIFVELRLIKSTFLFRNMFLGGFCCYFCHVVVLLLVFPCVSKSANI